ncbi:MAG: Panacea domain-containing protein [Aquificaceae bacterium]|nr:Panacea domain-containing protein [Aquificaceae bacterium]
MTRLWVLLALSSPRALLVYNLNVVEGGSSMWTICNEEGRKRLKELIWTILKMVGSVSKVKLAKLVLFSEIEHFRKYGKSYTGLYFVKLKYGPVIAFFEYVLEEEEGKSLKVEKEKYKYSLLEDFSPPLELSGVVEDVLNKYKDKSDSYLSELSHRLPAWKYSEEHEPIYIAELVIEEEDKYWLFVDVMEDVEEEDESMIAQILKDLPTGKRMA